MKKIPNVVLLIEQNRQHGRNILTGIAHYAKHFGPWSIFNSQPFFLNPDGDNIIQSLLKEGRADGIIMRESPLTDKIIEAGIPLILCPYTEKYYNPGVPVLIGDEQNSAVSAAEHLIDRGMRNFAFCGFNKFPWSNNRQDFFISYLAAKGFSAERYHQPDDYGWPEEKSYMTEWLRALPKPVGVMACTDDRSQHIVEACKSAELRIPDDVSVIGVDDDELICGLSNPTLTSVAINAVKAGYEAAALLAHIMNGAEGRTDRIIAEVTGISIRESTDRLAAADPELQNALIFIRDNSNRIIGVEDVVESTCLSRRSLEKRFADALGTTIYDRVSRSRAERIARILIETDYPISKIAFDLGYSSEDHIARFFKKQTGETPLNYRRKNRLS